MSRRPSSKQLDVLRAVCAGHDPLDGLEGAAWRGRAKTIRSCEGAGWIEIFRENTDNGWRAGYLLTEAGKRALADVKAPKYARMTA